MMNKHTINYMPR